MRIWQVNLMALGGVSLLLFLGILGIYRTIDVVYIEQPFASVVVGELLASTSVGQTFIAKYSGLCGVELYLATYARRNTGPLIFHLQTILDATDLVTITLDASQIKDNAYHAFEFAPLWNVKGQLFYFFIEAPQAVPGNAITVWGTKEDAYTEGEAIIKGVHRSDIRDLTFRLRFCPPLVEKASFFLHRLTANKPSIWGDANLYVCLGVSYLGLIYIILVFVLKEGVKAT